MDKVDLLHYCYWCFGNSRTLFKVDGQYITTSNGGAMGKVILMLLPLVVGSNAMAADIEYTLYRTGMNIPTGKEDEAARIHVATFDTKENADYNRANCETTQELFNANQPAYRNTIFANIKLKYWCEKGLFKK
jgi:hypothetical protein